MGLRPTRQDENALPSSAAVPGRGPFRQAHRARGRGRPRYVFDGAERRTCFPHAPYNPFGNARTRVRSPVLAAGLLG